jgi:hypothetical protein
LATQTKLTTMIKNMNDDTFRIHKAFTKVVETDS